ncbi:MAG: phosphoglucosamine mutase [Planctomycetota bacterium]
MSRELIIGISGLRGIPAENLTAKAAEDYGRAFGVFLKESGVREGRVGVCIGRDSRTSGPMLRSAVTSGLCSVGVSVVDLGIVSTPGVSIMTKELDCAGGVVITASHNPIEYNGIKLLLGSGMAPPREAAERIKQIYLNDEFDSFQKSGQGGRSKNDHTDEIHIKKVLGIIDRVSIARCGFKVVLDSVNGAGGRVAKKLLAELGCEVIAINDKPTGIFAHEPEPLRQNLGQLCEEVKKNGADVGFAQDPDADRLAIVDENGSYIGEEYTLALAAKYVLSERPGRVATNLSTSRMIDDIAGPGSVIRTAVGEVNVAEAMLKNDCVIGGEGNGGVIDVRIGPVRDSLAAMGFVLQLMARERLSISELVAGIPAYHMVKEKFTIEGDLAEKMLDEAGKVFSDARVDRSDGVRFDFSEGWLHLRRSNTEPIMRAIAEAEIADKARGYIDMVLKIRDKVMG